MPKLNIIFLDMDGPMIGYGGRARNRPRKEQFIYPGFPLLSGFMEESKDYIRKLCEEYDAKIVTNSSHNSGIPLYNDDDEIIGDRGGLEHIHELMRLNGMEDLLYEGSEGHITQYPFKHSRANAVINWIENCEDEVDAFIIFDDETSSFKGAFRKEHFIATGSCGLSLDNYTRARKLFNDQLGIK